MKFLLLFLFMLQGLALESATAFDPAAHPAIEERQIAGYTRPVAMLDLAPEVAGRLTLVAPQAGDRLAPDQGIIVRLDPSLADFAIAQAEALVAAATAGIGLRRAEIARATHERELATREAERQDQLGQMVSASVRDNAVTGRSRAEAVVAAAESGLIQAEAETQTAHARLAETRELRRRHDLQGPAGWVVSERLLEPGALVAAGQAVLRLADVRELVVPLRLDEDEVTAIRVARVVPVAIAGRVVPARLRRVDVVFDPVSRKRLAELVVAGSELAEASGGLPVELRVLVPNPALADIPAAQVQWRLEQPWLRPVEGAPICPPYLRRTAGGGIIVRRADLPVGVRLLPAAE